MRAIHVDTIDIMGSISLIIERYQLTFAELALGRKRVGWGRLHKTYGDEADDGPNVSQNQSM